MVNREGSLYRYPTTNKCIVFDVVVYTLMWSTENRVEKKLGITLRDRVEKKSEAEHGS